MSTAGDCRMLGPVTRVNVVSQQLFSLKKLINNRVQTTESCHFFEPEQKEEE